MAGTAQNAWQAIDELLGMWDTRGGMRSPRHADPDRRADWEDEVARLRELARGFDADDVRGFRDRVVFEATDHGLDHDLTEHVRRYRPPEGSPTVVMDTRHRWLLKGLLGTAGAVGTVHPNQDLDELVIPIGERVFGIRAKNLSQQIAMIKIAVEKLLIHSRRVRSVLRLVVVPELATSSSILRELQEWLDELPEPLIVVAGSYHRRVSSTNRNTVVVLLPHTTPVRQNKLEPWDRRPEDGSLVMEDITPGDTLTVLTAGRHRLAVAICRDYLVHHPLIAHLGATFVAVPAMTAKMLPFQQAGAGSAIRAQSVIAIANNPVHWPDTAPDVAVFLQPTARRSMHQVSPDDVSPPGAAHMALGGRADGL